MKTLISTLSLAALLACFAPTAFAEEALWADGNCGPDWAPIKRSAPAYPRRARQMGIEGYIVMSFSVNTDGQIEDIAVLEAKPERAFVRSATKAVESLEFPPCLNNGLATRVTDLSIKYDFNLGG